MNQRRMALLSCSLFLLLLTISVCNSAQSVMLNDYVSFYSLESGSQGLIGTSQSLGSLVMLLVSGALLRWRGKPMLIGVCALLLPVSMFLMGIAPPFSLMCFAYLLLGFSFTTADATACALMVDYYGEKSAKYNSWLRASLGLGGLVGPLSISYMIGIGLSWQTVLLILAGVAAVVMVIYALCAGKQLNVRSSEQEQTKRLRFQTIRQFLADPDNRRLALCSMLFGVHGTGTVWIVRYVSLYLDAPSLGALAFSILWFCIAIARLVVPKFVRSQTRTILIGSLLAGVLLTIGVFCNNAVLFCIFLAAAGFCIGTPQPFVCDLCSRNATHENGVGSGSASMLMLLSSNVGASFTLPLIGYLFERFGATAGMMVMSLSPLLVALCILPICRRDRQRLQPTAPVQR